MILLLISGWHITILVLALCMLLCAGITIALRFMRKRKAARLFFTLVIAFMLAGFTTILVYANKVVEEKRTEIKDIPGSACPMGG